MACRTYVFSGIILCLAMLNGSLWAAAGDLDASFNAVPPPTYVTSRVAVQDDHRILAVAGISPTRRLLRYMPDGSTDSSFTPGYANSTTSSQSFISVIRPLANGNILVGGKFNHYNGTAANNIVRLRRDGSIDPSFRTGTGFSADVSALRIQPSGQILVGGWFDEYNGAPIVGAARLNPDGSLDTGFDPGAGPTSFMGGGNRTVYDFHTLSGGQIIVVGYFSEFNGVPRQGIVRLNADGSVDTSFDAQMAPGTTTGNSAIAYSVTGVSNNKLLISGSLGDFGGQPRAHIARLNDDGTIDTSFDTDLWPNYGSVSSVTVQPDNKLLVSGNLRLMSTGTTDYQLVRLLADGQIDTGFNTLADPNHTVSDLRLQTDGKLVIGGSFDDIRGTARENLARLLGDTSSASGTSGSVGGSGTGTSSSGTGTGTVSTTPVVIAGSGFPITSTSGLRLILSPWATATRLGNGWEWLPWFGMYNRTHSPWIYHWDHGYIYLSPASVTAADMWFYQQPLGWFWTNQRSYPKIYRNHDGVWLGYMHGTKNPRWFWNYSTSAIEQIP